MVCRLVKSLASPYVSSEQNGDRRSRSSGIDRSVLFFATSVTIAVRAIRPGPFLSSAALRRRKKTDSQYPVAASLGPAGIKPTQAKKYSIERF
jgi:hypothetical protein